MNQLIIPDIYSLVTQQDIVKNALLLYEEVLIPTFQRKGEQGNISQDLLISGVRNTLWYTDSELVIPQVESIKSSEAIFAKLYESDSIVLTEIQMGVDYQNNNIYIEDMANNIFHSPIKKKEEEYLKSKYYIEANLRDIYVKLTTDKMEATLLKPAYKNPLYEIKLYLNNSGAEPNISDLNIIKLKIMEFCKITLPNFGVLSYDEIINLRKKYSSLLAPARMHISELIYQIRRDLLQEKETEQEKYIKQYVNNLINPKIEEFVKNIESENKSLIFKIFKHSLGMVEVAFSGGVRAPIVAAKLIKAGLELNEDMQKNLNREQAFLTLIGKSYKKQ